jgi:hypothetical protein
MARLLDTTVSKQVVPYKDPASFKAPLEAFSLSQAGSPYNEDLSYAT